MKRFQHSLITQDRQMSPLIEEMVEAWVAKAEASSSPLRPELVHSSAGESNTSSDGVLDQSPETGELSDRPRGREGTIAPSDRILSSLVRRMPIAAALVDSKGGLFFTNKAYWSLTGKTKAEVPMPTLENVWPAGVAKMATRFDGVARERYVPMLALERIPIDEGSLELLTIRFALRDTEGEEEYVVFLGLDLSSMRKATKVLIDALKRALPNAPREVFQFTPGRPGFLRRVTTDHEDE